MTANRHDQVAASPSGDTLQKKKLARLGGFVGALCASGALVGFAVSGTGAYFTDSHNGSVNASTGDVKVNTSNLTLNFQNLLPGEFKTNTVTYTAAGTEAEDIWLVLPTDGSAVAFNGSPSSAAVNAPNDGCFTEPEGA